MPSSGNHILDCLWQEDWERIAPLLELVTLRFRQRLEEAGRRIDALYFLKNGLASVVTNAGARQQQSEVAIIGREGFSGAASLLGAERASNDVFMQVEGSGWRADAAKIFELTAQRPSLLHHLLKGIHVLMVQVDQTALANARGSVEERLARWLLMAQDRLETDEVLLTHDYLALMLGTRRASVTAALHCLAALGAVECRRGTIRIVSRAHLLDAASGFYGEPERVFAKVFGASLVPER